MLLFGGVFGLNRRLCFHSILALFLLSTIFLPHTVLAERKLRVFKNQYLIELKDSETGAEVSSSGDSELRRAGARVMRSLGRGTRGGKMKLVRPETVAAGEVTTNGSGVIVDYNPSDSFCAKLIASGKVTSCSPDFEIRALATSNDPSLPSLWGMSATSGIDAVGAWDTNTGSHQVVVAVIDTGVDYTHPDLAANMWTNTGEVPANGVDDDGNGYIDDYYGWNAFSNNGNPMDDNGHGTHCAGTIGGVGNNGIGVVGVNWNVKIMALKFLSANGSGSLSGAVAAINYMNTMKARGVNIKVSSNSWGGGGFSQSLYNAISYANELGIAFVAASGNETNDNDASASYPAGYELPNVISVAAVDSDRNLASFSNYGATTVDIAAPGVGILSTYPGNRYATLSGTSMATPHVSGALALLWANEPALTVTAARDRVDATGVPLATLTGLIRTGRMLNVARMLRNETTPLPPPAPTPIPCNYSAGVVAFAPDTSVAAEPGILQADELNYTKVNLPFSFPFYGQNVSSIYVSPNGVVYTKSAPTGMDYINKSAAPSNSIAALQTDLTTADSPYMVRAKVAADSVTINWYAQSYAVKGSGDIQVWLTIYSNGTIQSFMQFSSSAVTQQMQQNSTIGVSGPSGTNSTTYAYNSSAISSGLGVSFAPQCDSSGGGGGGSVPGEVSSIQLFGRSNGGKLSKRAEEGGMVRIQLNGQGNGPVELKAAFGNRSCAGSSVVNLSGGGATVEARLPQLPDEFSSFKVRSGSGKKSIAVAHRRARSSHRANSKRLSARKFNTLCGKLFSSVSSI